MFICMPPNPELRSLLLSILSSVRGKVMVGATGGAVSTTNDLKTLRRLSETSFTSKDNVYLPSINGKPNVTRNPSLEASAGPFRSATFSQCSLSREYRMDAILCCASETKPVNTGLEVFKREFENIPDMERVALFVMENLRS